MENIKPNLNNLDKGSLLQAKKFTYESIYKEDGVHGITSPILKALIEKGIKDEKFQVNKPIEFKVLNKDDANKQLDELAQFRSEINKIQKDEVNIIEDQSTLIIAEQLKSNEIEVIKEDGVIKIINEDQSSVIEINEEEALAKVQNSIKFFKEKNLEHDAKWEEFQRKLDVQAKVGNSETLGLNDMKSINDTYFKNKDEIVNTLKREKPLGELGEITLNELIVKGSEVITPIFNINNISTGIGSGFAGLSLFFMYKGVVRLFDSLAFKDYPKNIPSEKLVDYKRMRARELKTFMILGAPFIVGSLYAIKQVSFPTKGNVDLQHDTASAPASANQKIAGGAVSTSEVKENFKDQTITSGTSTFFAAVISFIKNKIPNWLKYIILITISFISFNYFIKNNNLIYCEGANINSILLNNLIIVKLFFVIGSISSFILIFYYLLNIYLYIMFSNNKITVKDCPIYFPQFILNWLNFIEKMSKNEDKGYYIEYYLRLIIVYLLIFLMCISILIKLAGI